jgi:hypothetical protein
VVRTYELGEQMRVTDLPFYTDEEWRAYKASQDRERAYDLGVKTVCLAIGILALLLACGALDWLVAL